MIPETASHGNVTVLVLVALVAFVALVWSGHRSDSEGQPWRGSSRSRTRSDRLGSD